MTSGNMKRFSSQHGLSLIGLLIGLLISVLCILASLGLYKNLIQVATESKLDSNHDGQLTAALLVIQMEVQSAGYGIENAKNGVDIVTTFDGAAKKRQLLWRFKPGAAFECRGLHEEELAEGGAVFRVLKLITTTGCTQTAALSGLPWAVSTPVAVLGRWRVIDDGVAATGLDKYISDNTTLFGYGFGNATCSPYGASTTTTNRSQLTVTAPGTAYLQGAAGLALNSYSFCLPNIYP